jgi:phosphatidylserine/phosphatidylglycerophosphate/cardiolipin synthase-like enzyme
MLFHGLQRMELSKANYTAESFVPGFLEGTGHPERGWFDEAVLFLSDPSILASFRTQFENYWTDTVQFTELANSPGPPVRRYQPSPIDPAVNFHPIQRFSDRVIGRIDQESVGVDVIEFRIVYLRAADALIAAHRRGARVRVLVEPEAWNNPTYTTHRQSIARLVSAGVPVRYREHPGLTHEGLVVLHGLQEAVFGSSNLNNTDMLEHNIFFGPGQGPVLYDGQTAFEWFRDQFQRKWDNVTAFATVRSH